MRYFQISYVIGLNSGKKLHIGSMTCHGEVFPPLSYIERKAQEIHGADKDTPVTPLSFFEFKSKEDHDSFN